MFQVLTRQSPERISEPLFRACAIAAGPIPRLERKRRGKFGLASFRGTKYWTWLAEEASFVIALDLSPKRRWVKKVCFQGKTRKNFRSALGILVARNRPKGWGSCEFDGSLVLD